MYYINKIVGWVMSPYGLFYLGLLMAWLMHWRWPRMARGVAIAALVVFWVLGCGVTTMIIGAPLEREFVHEGEMCGVVREAPKVDLIMLLGGGVGSHERCGAVELFQAADRVREAAVLWRLMENARSPGQNAPAKIFCTGGGVEKSTIPFLMELGVPREAIDFSEIPRTTAEEAALIKSRGVKRVALVTSAWHMKRARMLFERQGLEVVPVAADFEMTYCREKGVEFKDFFPSGDALNHNSAALKEWVAIVGYSIF